MFLRNSGEAPTWTVLVLQNKFWFKDTETVKRSERKTRFPKRGNTASARKEISVVAKWRDSIGHLPATVVDAEGKEHTLRYLRILVTANPVEERHFTPLAKDSDEQVKRIDLLGRANAAFVDSDANRFDRISALAGKWVDETRAKYEVAKMKYEEEKMKYEEEKIKREEKKSLKRHPKRQADEPKPPLKNEHLKAGKRARELLGQLGSKGAMERGEVLGECRMYLERITQWCPTVGLFASNIVVIRDLAGDSAVDNARGGK